MLYTTSRDDSKCIAKANQGGAPVYQCVFAWEFPCFGGVPAWHTGDNLPFIFDNVEFIDYLVAGNVTSTRDLG